MPTNLRAILVALLLAALAYLLYLWSRRKDEISCPSCGGRVNLYAEECPHCGHLKGAPVSDDDEVPAEYAEMVTAHTVQEVKDKVRQEGLDPEKVRQAEEANDDRVTLTRWLDEQKKIHALVEDGTVAHVQRIVDDEDLDPEAVLAAEKAHQDRKTLTDWLEERI